MDIENDTKGLQEVGDFIKKEKTKQLNYLTRRYSISKENAEDVFQESSLALFRNIKDGRLVNLTSTLSTYFTSICINQARKFFKKNEKEQLDDESIPYDSEKIDELCGLTHEGLSESQSVFMREIVSSLPEPCEKILWSYYADEMSMVEIAIELKYKNADTVKSKKSQCMSKLKAKFTNQLKTDFYDRD